MLQLVRLYWSALLRLVLSSLLPCGVVSSTGVSVATVASTTASDAPLSLILWDLGIMISR